VTESLKGKFSSDFDEILENLVKQCITQIKKPLLHIYTASLRSSIFPDRLKIALVKPVYIKGDIHDVQNYRPILILLIFFKKTGKVNV